MAHLKQYGKYWVFAAMTVSGVFVWNSQKTVISGEDAAELFNAAAERFLVATLESDETPDWYSSDPTNLFPSAVPTKDFRDRLLDRSVEAFLLSSAYYNPPPEGGTNGYFSGVSGFPGSEDIVWLLSTNNVYSGSTSLVTNETGVASSTYNYYGLSITKYTAKSSSNFVDGAMTSASVQRPGSMPFPDPVPMTNQPLTGIFGIPVSSIYPRVGFSFPFPDEGCAWNTNAGRVAFTFYSQERPNDRVLYKRDLLGPASVLSNLCVTIIRVAAPTMVKTNMNSGSVVNTTLTSYTAPTAYLNDCHNSATNRAPGHSSYDWAYSFFYEHYKDITYDSGVPTEEYYSFSYYKNVFSNVAYKADQRLSYPSAYAVTNGYVSRIRVFGVYEGTVDQIVDFDTLVNEDYPVFEASYAGDISEVGGVSFSHPLSYMDLSGFDRTADLGDLSTPLDNYTGSFRQHSPCIALLYDKANPTSVSDLMWTNAAMPYLTISAPPSVNHTIGYEGRPGEGTDSYDGVLYSYSVDVWVQSVSYIVVVDWRWKFLTNE